MSVSWESKLTALDEGESTAAWAAFFLNEVAVVQFFRESQPSSVSAVLSAGSQWSGAGWDTTKCAKTVRTLTGVAMVTNELKDYLHAFLFSLALVANLDLPSLELSDKASDVAFRLADRWQELLGTPVVPGLELRAKREPGAEDPDSGAEEDEPRLPWEDEVVPLPEDLKVVLERLNAGGRAEARRLLEQVPVFRGLKVRSEDNNHKGDSKGSYDKLLKSIQQRLLNLARVQVALHTLVQQSGPEAAMLSQMQWMYLMETESMVLKERKKASIPASVAESGNALFSMDDLKHEKQVLQINRAGGMVASQFRWSYFQSCPGFRSWKFRPGKGRGKSYSSSYGAAGQWQWNAQARGGGRKGKGGGRSNAAIAAAVYGRLAQAHGGSGSQKVTRGQEPQFGAHGGQYIDGHGALRAFDTEHRAGMGPGTTVPQVESLPSLVEAACPKRGFGIDHAGCAARLPSPSFVSKMQAGTFERGRESPENSQRIPGCGSYTTFGCKSFPHKAFSPLVCAIQNGTSGGKTSFDSRLQGVKSIFSPFSFQAGPLAKHFSLHEKGSVGSKGRFEGCLLSFRPSPLITRQSENAGGRGTLGVQGSLFWHKHFTPKVYATHEGVGKNLEKPRNPMFCLPGRYLGFGKHPQCGETSHSHHGGNLVVGRVQDKRSQVSFDTHTESSTLGVCAEFEFGGVGDTLPQDEGFEERNGEIVNKDKDVLQKAGCNFGDHSQQFGSRPILKGLHRPTGVVCQSAQPIWLGSSSAHSIGNEGAIARNKRFAGQLAWQKICHPSSKGNSHRQLHMGLGRIGHHFWKICPGFLEGKKFPPHKLERIASSNFFSAEFGQKRGTCPPECGQFSGLQLFSKRGRQDTQSKCFTQAISKMVHKKSGTFVCAMGSFQRNEGRQFVKMGNGQGGLHLTPGSIQCAPLPFLSLDYSFGGHVCKPRECKIHKVCDKVASFSGSGSGCIEMSTKPIFSGLCQSPLVHHSPMATSSQGESPFNMPSDLSKMGFQHMVAPINKNENSTHTLFGNRASGWHVSKLPRHLDAKAKMAPFLCDALRKVLQDQQMSPEAIENYIGKIGSMGRYNKPFQVIWAMLVEKGISPPEATLQQVASALMELHSFSASQARNAYSALMKFPSFQGLQFFTPLKPFKALWNQSVSKYATFWEPEPILAAMAADQLDMKDVRAVRDRLILVCRLITLHRGVDLSRLQRVVSMVNGRPFMLVQRKGWKSKRWEQIISLPLCPQLSPWHLIKAYVSMTKAQASPGGYLLLSLAAPWKPLTANTVNSITKQLLKKYGVNTAFWGAHSTRGAGVSFYKRLGLSSEAVCELGQWKNVQAFSAHYLRLNAAVSAQEKIQEHLGNISVHRVSPGDCAEPDWSSTPGMKEAGGIDQEGEAQDTGDPAPPPRTVSARKKKTSKVKDVPAKFFFAKQAGARGPSANSGNRKQ